MAIEDVYKKLEELEGVDTEGIRADIAAEFGTVTEGAQARVDELISENSELKTQLTEMKARNYELLVASTGAQAQAQEPDEGDPETPEIDDLFKED